MGVGYTKKRNLGLIKQVEYKKIGKLKDSFAYVSLFQLRKLSMEENIVNPHFNETDAILNQMKALLIGNGQHTNRRIVPALKKSLTLKKF